jgi:hypothetical protein
MQHQDLQLPPHSGHSLLHGKTNRETPMTTSPSDATLLLVWRAGHRRRARRFELADPQWQKAFRFLSGIPSARAQIFYDHE